VVLGLLPLIAILTVAFAAGNAFPDWGWRRSFLRSTAGLGAYMLITAEGLSLVAGITRGVEIVVWLLPTVLAGAWLVRRVRLGGSITWPHWERPGGILDWMILGGGLGILLITALIAWVSPPNTWDSLTYHMARVAHWAQDRSLAPFATGNERQNFMPPAAEIAMLQIYVLAGGDRLVNFVEWFAMLGCVVGVIRIAKDLTANRLGQTFAAIFVLTLPMGIAQASSTMTDYVVALWMVVVSSEMVWLMRRHSIVTSVIFLGLAAGLAIATKPTSFAYLLPFAVGAIVVLARRSRLPLFLVSCLIATAVVIALNAGYFSRNMTLYGNPLGSASRISAHENEILDWRVVVSNMLRNASLHASTPNPYVNKGIAVVIVKIHQWIGLDPTDPRTSAHLIFRVGSPSLNEAKAGNFAQAVLILVASALAVWKRKSFDPILLGLGAIVVATFIVLSVAFKYTVFGSRYQLPFFVLCAPLVAYVFSRLVPPVGVKWVALGLCLACVPWLIHLDPRPLLSTPGTGESSILTKPRESLYFTLDPSAERPYAEMTSIINRAGCSSVGLMLSGGAAEYPLWPMLGAPRNDLTIEAIVAGTASDRYSRQGFEPCAIICDHSCSDQSTIRGLSLVEDVSGYRLYMK
jgi:hypothetical protein